MSCMVSGPPPGSVKVGCGPGVNLRRTPTGPPYQAADSGGSPAKTGFGPDCTEVMGRRTVTIIPLPGEDVAETVPPCAATMAATMERPRPLPPLVRVRGRVDPVEALEDPAGLFVGHAGPRVAHLDLGLVADLVHPHRGRGPRRRVGPHVGQEVVEDLAQPVPVAGHLHRVRGPEPHRPLGPDGGRSPDRIGGQGHELDGRHLHGHALVQAGQGEEVVDQAIHARRLDADARDDAGQVVGVLGPAALEQLGVGRHRGDGRAELVRGVGDELAQVLLVLPEAGFGSEAGVKGGLDPLEHDVERPRQPPDLGRLVGARDPLVEVPRRDGVGGALDVLQRPQAEPDQPPPGGEREHDGTGRDGELDEEQVVQRARLVDECLRLHQDVAAVGGSRDLGCADAEGRASRSDGARGELGHLRPVGLGR